MKNKLVILGIATFMASGVGLAIAKDSNAKQEARDTHIIVQLDSSYNAIRNKNEQSRVISYIRNAVTSNIEVETRFNNVINGFVLGVNSKYVSQIRNVPGVKEVNYDSLHFVEYHEEDLARKNAAVIIEDTTRNISKQTMEIPDGTNEGEGTVIAILDSSFMINATYKDDDNKEWTNVSHAAYTDLDEGVDTKLTQQGIRNIVLSNPSFHGRFDNEHSTYFNSKVPFYYDYGGAITINEDDDDYGAGEEDYDVFTTVSDHGNHVATIAAGNDPYYKGIAPKAQLVLMKVFTDRTIQYNDGTKASSTGAYDSSILKAFEDCALLGVDVINMSLGSALNEFSAKDSITGKAIARLQKQGITFSISAGNEGKDNFVESSYEFWTTDMAETGILGHYAADENAIGVASMQPDEQYYDTALKVGDNIVPFKDQIVNYTGSDGEEVVYEPERHLVDLLTTYPDGNFNWIRIPGVGAASDYKENNITVDDVTGKIAIIDRGEINFSLKIENAVAYGAIAVGIIDNDPSQTDFNFTMAGLNKKTPVPVFSILNKNKKTFDITTDYTCQLFQNVVELNPKARQISEFSSDGMTYDLAIKPDVAAPGSNILGGVYAGGPNSYDYYSGTSMSAPNYSGAYALLLSEHVDDANWRATLNDRLMSGATPSVDRYGENQEPVRKQGAGLVNLRNSLETEVILDGSSNPEELKGTAKIELGNREDIKNGTLNLDFTTISSAASAITYNVEVTINRPTTVSNYLDEERWGKALHDALLVRNIDECITTFKTILNVAPGANAAHLSTELSQEAKKAIDDIFENGCVIEGFITLKAEGKAEISMPYLGYYGNLEDALPIEPFKFERDNSKVYPSDLVNGVIRRWKGLTSTDYASDWVMGNWNNLEDLSLSGLIKNETLLRDTIDGNKKKVVPVGTNPYTGEIGTTDIYMGNNGYTNTMIISQFVMRSIYTNTLTITNKATGKTVLTDHMFDSFFGALEDENGRDYQWPLYKSFVDVNYWSAGYIAHRAYTFIPLYHYTYNEKLPEGQRYVVGNPFEDGEYEIKFNYTLASGGTYEKSYTLHIDSETPQIKEITNFEKDGENYYRIRYDELKLSYLTINGYKYEVEQDKDGFYVDVKAADYDKVVVRSYDYSFGTQGAITHLSDTNHVSVASIDFIANNLDFTYDLKETGENSRSISFKFTKSGKTYKYEGNLSISLALPAIEGKLVQAQVIEVEKSGNEKEVACLAFNSSIFFKGNALSTFKITFSYVDAPVEEPEDDPTPTPSKKKGCGGNVVTTSALLAAVSTMALGLALVRFVKAKKEN